MTQAGADGAGLARAAAALAGALRRETALARSGSLPALLAASAAKQAAFRSFQRAATLGRAPSAAEIAALRDLVRVADESLLVLGAVRTVFSRFADQVREALRTAADPGVYDASGRSCRRVQAARINAVI